MAWLLAVLDEHERIARAAEERAASPWRTHPDGGLVQHSGPEDDDDVFVSRRRRNHGLWDSEGCYNGDYSRICMQNAVAAHVAQHHPAAVLADIAAKRAIIEQHGAYDCEGAVYPEAYTYCRTCGPGDHWSVSEAADAAVDDASKHPCLTLRTVTSSYAHCSGYHQATSGA